MNETVSRPSDLHASRNQTASSAARVVATSSTAPSLTVAVYAQPPCIFTSSEPLRHPSWTSLSQVCCLSLSPSAISQTVVRKRAVPVQFPRPTTGEVRPCESRPRLNVHRALARPTSRPAIPEGPRRITKPCPSRLRRLFPATGRSLRKLRRQSAGALLAAAAGLMTANAQQSSDFCNKICQKQTFYPLCPQ
jgi:hypothetical protein